MAQRKSRSLKLSSKCRFFSVDRSRLGWPGRGCWFWGAAGTAGAAGLVTAEAGAAGLAIGLAGAGGAGLSMGVAGAAGFVSASALPRRGIAGLAGAAGAAGFSTSGKPSLVPACSPPSTCPA